MYPTRTTTIVRVKRSDVQPGDVIVGSARRELPLERRQRPRPPYLRRTSSLDRDGFSPLSRRDRRTSPRRRDRQDSEDDGGYGSEGSIPPRSRISASAKGKQARPESANGKRNDEGSATASSSDLGSTTDDEAKSKKAKWKKWGAVGLASIATIHAVHGVHETVEKAKARRKELAEGDISEEEARKMRNRARWKNAASVGIAGIWVKGAYDELEEYREAQREHIEARERSEARHLRRLERAKAIRNGEYRGHHTLSGHERRKFLQAAAEAND